MPYISQERRKRLNENFYVACNAGELNYCFTKLAKAYFEDCGHNYKAINDVIGALEGAKQEFYRRIAAPYEDTKIIENGDMYNDRNEQLQPETTQGAEAA